MASTKRAASPLKEPPQKSPTGIIDFYQPAEPVVRDVSKMDDMQRTAAYSIAASKYVREHKAATCAAGPDGLDSYAADDVIASACLVEPTRLKNAAMRDEAIKLLGAKPFLLDSDFTTFTRHSNMVRVTEHSRTGCDAFNKAHTFTESKLERLALGKEGSSDDRDEKRVTVKIKTGKGGWQVFDVAEKDAKDMQGF